MKKIVLIAIVIITWALLVYNGVKAQDMPEVTTELEKMLRIANQIPLTSTKTECISGYLFAIVGNIGGSIAITQIWEHRFYNGWHKSQPMKCKKDSKQ